MKNLGTILLSAGVLLLGFSLLTPLLFFFIEALVGKGFDLDELLGMQYALLSSIALVLLVLGSKFSNKFSISITILSVMTALAMVGSFSASDPRGVLDWVVTGCYYLLLLIILGRGIIMLHRQPS